MSGETGQEESGWTVDTLHQHTQLMLAQVNQKVNGRIDDLKDLLNERYVTQSKAVEAAFVAQQTAMNTALSASEKAVNFALDAAEKAVIKAENATEKRFASVNEFRGQLADQANTFMPRTEADSRLLSIAEKLDSETSRFNEITTRIERNFGSRLDLIQGAGAGRTIQQADQRQIVTMVISALGLLVVILSTTLAILVATR